MTVASKLPFPPPKAGQLTASPRIFKNALLDRLSRAHWTVPFVYLVPVLLLLWEGAGQLSTLSLILCVVLGYLAWTLTEYSVHRFSCTSTFPAIPARAFIFSSMEFTMTIPAILCAWSCRP